MLRQLDSNKTLTAISVGDASWQDYTIRLKARKTGGAEGFIVRLRDQGNRHVQVNFGGWKNTAHGIEQNSPNNPLVQKPGTIETNRWYDVEITLEGDRVSAKLDGKTLFDRVAVPVTAVPGPGVALVSGYDKQAGEIIVKCVNPVAEARSLQLKLSGAEVPAQKARRVTLTGTGSDTNDLDHPDRVSPAEDRFAVSGSAVKLDLKPSSLTILRVKARLK
jgi:alpha-L-arabinofuranosidase